MAPWAESNRRRLPRNKASEEWHRTKHSFFLRPFDGLTTKRLVNAVNLASHARMRFLPLLFLLAFGCSESTGGVCLVSNRTGIDLGQDSNVRIRDTTAGASNDFTPPRGCPLNDRSDAPDLVYTWTAPAGGTYRLEADGMGFDPIVTVHRGSLEGEVAACDDDSGPSTDTLLYFDAEPCETFVLVVDGWSTSRGDFVLTINPHEGPRVYDDAGVGGDSGTDPDLEH